MSVIIRFGGAVVLVVIAVLGFGISLTTWARGSGERIAIYLDSGNDDRENRQMGARMQLDLKNVLERRGGYSSRILRSRDEFKAGQGEYLLDVKIVRYNSGSKAARIIVGFGAGTCTLDIHYELIGPGGNTLISKDDGCASSLDWQRLARKLNENMLAAIQAQLRYGNVNVDVLPPPRKVEPDVASLPVIQPAPVVQPATATAPVVTPPPAPVTPVVTAPVDPVAQLRQLDQMKKQRLISDGEYKQKRKEILGRL